MVIIIYNSYFTNQKCNIIRFVYYIIKYYTFIVLYNILYYISKQLKK